MQRKIWCAALTQGETVPSTRFRWTQHENELLSYGVASCHLTARYGSYAPERFLERPLWLSAALIDAGKRVVAAQSADVCFLQRSLIAKFASFEKYLKPPVVLDLDDAIFHTLSSQSYRKLTDRADIVICGNEYIANFFDDRSDIRILPTAVDTDRFIPRLRVESEKVVLGWSGTSWSYKWLYDVEIGIAKALKECPELVLKIIADVPPRFTHIPQDRLIFETWSADSEVDQISSFDIGLMPLPDEAWTRGKCSFKMLLYMSVGIPSIASPVGMNEDVLGLADLGLPAVSPLDYCDAIVFLTRNKSRRDEQGRAGRLIAESHFSTKVITRKLGKILREASEL